MQSAYYTTGTLLVLPRHTYLHSGTWGGKKEKKKKREKKRKTHYNLARVASIGSGREEASFSLLFHTHVWVLAVEYCRHRYLEAVGEVGTASGLEYLCLSDW